MKTVAILQARIGSTRLPGKVVMPLAGKPMLQNIIERVQRAKRIQEIVVTAPVEDVMTIGHAVPHGVFIDPWMGSENDLVGRYLGAAQAMGADLIVRIPCDNPCVDPAYIDEAVGMYLHGPWVFYSNTTSARLGTPAWIDGLGVEVLSRSRLKWLDRITASSPLQREHPHLYFRETGLIHWYEAWSRSSVDATLHLDVNTLDDYHFIEKIYNHFGHNRFTAAEVLACPPVQERLHGR